MGLYQRTENGSASLFGFATLVFAAWVLGQVLSAPVGIVGKVVLLVGAGVIVWSALLAFPSTRVWASKGLLRRTGWRGRLAVGVWFIVFLVGTLLVGGVMA